MCVVFLSFVAVVFKHHYTGRVSKRNAMATTNKKSFILYYDSVEIFNELSDEEAGQLIKAICNLQTNGEMPTDKTIRMLLLPFKNQFKRDIEKYEKVCERNKRNASSRSQSHPMDASGNDMDAYSDTDSDTDSDSGKDTVTNIPYNNISVKNKEVLESFENDDIFAKDKLQDGKHRI